MPNVSYNNSHHVVHRVLVSVVCYKEPLNEVAALIAKCCTHPLFTCSPILHVQCTVWYCYHNVLLTYFRGPKFKQAGNKAAGSTAVDQLWFSA